MYIVRRYSEQRSKLNIYEICFSNNIPERNLSYEFSICGYVNDYKTVTIFNLFVGFSELG